MNSQQLIERFTALVNSGQPAYELLRAEGHSGDLLDALRDMHAEASQPTVFYQQPLTSLDARFEQVYELMRLTFDYAALEDRRVYRRAFQEQAAEDHCEIAWGRFFRVLGAHRYTPAGQLECFHFDRLSVTEGVVGVVQGGCFPLSAADMLAGLGYLAVRTGFQRRFGHGQALLTAFEQQALDCASRLGRRLRFIVLESEDSASSYWYKRGYRWPDGSRYTQPSLHRDPATGAALAPPARKHFMLKCLDDADAEALDYELLCDSLHALYEGWYAPGSDVPAAAARRIRADVFGDLAADFERSLRVVDGRVALLRPPAADW